jgi:hypothetical protein
MHLEKRRVLASAWHAYVEGLITWAQYRRIAYHILEDVR